MFRFNNPDALLVLLVTAAGYFVIRAIETPVGRTALRWLLFAGVAIGFAFLTKMMQGLLVLPAFALAYLVAGRSGLWTRIWHLLAAGAAVVVSAGWYVALVALWPADSRPYIGGSETNSLWELAIGYNGLGRIFGDSGGGGGRRPRRPAPGGGGRRSAAAVSAAPPASAGCSAPRSAREISWLIPAALIGLVAGLWFTRRLPAHRQDPGRPAALGRIADRHRAWCSRSWRARSTPTTRSRSRRPIAAVVAISGRELWRGRSNTVVRGVLAAMIAVTGVWSFILLGRDATWLPWLRWVVLIGSVVGAVLLVLVDARSCAGSRSIGLLVGSLTALSGTTAYTLATAATPHTGSIPTSGPTGSAMGGRAAVRPAVSRRGGSRPSGSDAAAGGTLRRARCRRPRRGDERRAGPSRHRRDAEHRRLPTGAAAGAFGGGAAAATTNSELVALLKATTTRWSAATTSAQSAAGYILATDTAVMGIGGFTGSDPSPTLAQFQQYVADGEISYFIAGGAGGGGGWRGGPGGGSGSGSEIQAWVRGELHRDDRRRRHRLRPDQRQTS